MREKHFFGLNPRGFHRVVYDEWGHSDAPRVLICVHGLTRNAKDFKWLAQSLASDWQVICPDMVGRGRSDWLHDPLRYTYPQYMADLNALLVSLAGKEVWWVGTSMGGLIGMMLAAMPQTPLKGLILNDIGPFVPASGLKRLMKYVPKRHVFREFEEVNKFLKTTLLGYQGVSALQWKEIAESSVRWDHGTHLWEVGYDPCVASTLKPDDVKDQDFWMHWENVNCPTLVMHGTDSDILTHSTVQQMANKPRVQTHSFPEQGHALSLATEGQLTVIQEWLCKHAA